MLATQLESLQVFTVSSLPSAISVPDKPFTIADMTATSRPQDDQERWSEWSRAHGPAVRGYVLAMLRRPDLAEDVTQEVFWRAWRGRQRYRETGTARAYLLRIADRLVCDHGRKLGREVHLSEEGWEQLEPAGGEQEPGQGLVQEEAFGQLQSALASLSPPQRRVLFLRYYGDLSFAEIAAILGCPLGTALSHCRRGLLTLRKLLVESYEA